MIELKKILEEMVFIPAPSGYKDAMSEYLLRIMGSYVDEIEIDRIGNLIVMVKGTSNNKPKIMVSAHMDQLELIVRRIDSNGYVQFERPGGIPERILPGSMFLILTDKEPVEAICGMKSHHITLPEEKYAIKSYLDLYLDIGAVNKQDFLDSGIEVGNPAVYKPTLSYLKNNCITGTSIDDRAGCAVMMGQASS